MVKIFISFRTQETPKNQSDRIYDHLIGVFGNVFKADRDQNIPDGTKFPDILNNAVTQCDVFLLIIGGNWLNLLNKKMKIPLDDDWVKKEILLAFSLNKLIIPVLLSNRRMPSENKLPDDLKPLTKIQARKIRGGDDFHTDINALITHIKSNFPESQASENDSIDVDVLFHSYSEAMATNRFQDAKQLAKKISANSNITSFIKANLLADEQKIENGIEADRFVSNRVRDYEYLRKSENGDKNRFRTAIHAFQKEYPNYDPDNLHFQNLEYVSKVYDYLSQPLFEWIRIPSGNVTLRKGGYISEETIFDVPEFAISKYPITKAQYLIFVNLHGYAQDRFWTTNGLEFRGRNTLQTQRMLTQPQNWEHLENILHPITGVSWYEAIAFCNWLSELTGEIIRLPTEQQWQFVAQGNDNHLYPWGNEWDATRCNHNVDGKGIGTTTDVRHYENATDDRNDGRSPFGVVDMSGNVVEWCLTGYEMGSNTIEGSERRCGRGGSWSHDSKESFQTTYRREQIPDLRYNDWGFRIVSLPKNQ